MRKTIATTLICTLAIGSVIGITGCSEARVESETVRVLASTTHIENVIETSGEGVTFKTEGNEANTAETTETTETKKGETSTAEVVDGADGKETGTKGTTGTEKVTGTTKGTTKSEGNTKATTSKVATGNVEPTREAYTYTKPNRVTATANTTKATTGTKNTTKATTKAVTATTKKANTTATTKAHTHTWLEYYGDLHTMVTKTRTVIVKEAWQEKISDGVAAWQCNECGFVGTPDEVSEHYDKALFIFAKYSTYGYNALTSEEKAFFNNNHQKGCSYANYGTYITAKYPSHYIEEPVYVDHPAVTKTETYQEEKVQKNLWLGTFCKECHAFINATTKEESEYEWNALQTDIKNGTITNVKMVAAK